MPLRYNSIIINWEGKMEFSDNLLLPLRQQQSTIPGRSPIEEFYSDKSRIIYSSSFRRLQQKAQVFSLEPNSNVRTRLTHSLEVADIGRIITFVYFSGIMFLTLSRGWSIFRLLTHISKGIKTTVSGFTLVESAAASSSFSFLHYIPLVQKHH